MTQTATILDLAALLKESLAGAALAAALLLAARALGQQGRTQTVLCPVRVRRRVDQS